MLLQHKFHTTSQREFSPEPLDDLPVAESRCGSSVVEQPKPGVADSDQTITPEPNIATPKPLEHHVRRGTTAIIMYDTRLPNITGTEWTYWQQTADLNSLYACYHGYDFIYYLNNDNGLLDEKDGIAGGHNSELKTKASCYFNRSIARGAPWCKLVGVAKAMADGYETVVLLDSDAYLKVGEKGLSIPTLERLYRGHHVAKRGAIHTFKPQASTQTAGKALYIAADYDTHKPNTGLQIWHNSIEAWALLRAWWSVNITNTVQSFEQTALISPEFEATGLQKHYALLGRLGWQTRVLWDEFPAVHINSFMSKKWRRDHFVQALKDTQVISRTLSVGDGGCPSSSSWIKHIDTNVEIAKLLETTTPHTA